jgi:aspartyl protease family protein
MRMQTGMLSAARELAGWLLIGLVGFGCLYYFADLSFVSQKILGVDLPSLHGSRPAPGGQTGPQKSAQPSGYDRQVHLQAADNGHFFSPVELNGHDISVMVDTGATDVALTYEDAEAAGLTVHERDFSVEMQTANGPGRAAPVMLDRIRIGDIEVRDVEAFVAEPGKLFQTLLGMSFLRRLSRIEMQGRELILTQ